MSLVIAYNAIERQVWCCDGRTVTPQNGRFVRSSDSAQKIRRISNSSILCGWIGDKYDADLIISAIPSPGNSSIEAWFNEVAFCCQHINRLSFDFCTNDNQAFCPTGLLVGGYHSGKRFLAIITPEGQVVSKNQYAAIGVGSETASERLYNVREHPLPVSRAYETIWDCVTDASREDEYVGGLVSWFFVSSGRCVEIPLKGRCNKGIREIGLDTIRVA
jgi:hypothetical protein